MIKSFHLREKEKILKKYCDFGDLKNAKIQLEKIQMSGFYREGTLEHILQRLPKENIYMEKWIEGEMRK